MKRFILCFLSMVTLLSASIENEIGISTHMTSIHNKGGLTFRNQGVGLTYQLNRYVVSPRFDLDYTKISDYEQVNSLLRASINALYEFENATEFLPYGLVGFGYEKVFSEVKDTFISHAFLQGGVGIAFTLQDGSKAKVEGRVLQIIGGDSEENEAIISMGMTIPLDYTPKHKALQRQRVQITEPILVRERRPIYIDSNKCPKKISAPDRDRDGVSNNRDQCPNTPCNFSVDRHGCPVKTTLRINFANNSSKIENYSMGKVENFAQFLLNNKGSMVKIVGHTDSIGEDTSNLLLSRSRANAVVQKLIELGVSSARIFSTGRGEKQPIASNSSPEGRRLNRRIEAQLSYPNRKIKR